MRRENRIVSVEGIPMIVYANDIISDVIFNTKIFWEYELFNDWKSHFPQNGLMLDLGANIGNHSLMFHKYFPNLNIWAFEMTFQSFNLLRANTENYPKITCFNVAVSDKAKFIKYSDHPSNNIGGIEIVEKGTYTNLAIPLDSLEVNEPITFIKIDIEGHELYAFKGMQNIIKNHKPMIWLEDFNGKSVQFLKDLGYEIIEYFEASSNYLLKFKK